MTFKTDANMIIYIFIYLQILLSHAWDIAGAGTEKYHNNTEANNSAHKFCG